MSKVINIGNFSEIAKLENGKAFIGGSLELTSCEVSVNVMPKGVKLPFSHKHIQNEEIYIFIKGTGSMTIDGKNFPIQEGTCIKVEPEEVRTMESISGLEYICIQAKKGSLTQSGLKDATLC